MSLQTYQEPSTSNAKITYSSTRKNYMIIEQVVTIPKVDPETKETLEELQDEMHLQSISKARLEYQNGDTITREGLEELLAE